MNTIIKKLRKEIVKEFVPIGQQLRDEGASDKEIVQAFYKHAEVKSRQYYSELKYNQTQLSPDLEAIKKSDSNSEIVFYNMLEKENFKFEFQYEIKPYRVDYLLYDILIVEVDGPHHNTLEQKQYDKRRDKYLIDMGYKVLRFPLFLVIMNIKGIIEQIRTELRKVGIEA